MAIDWIRPTPQGLYVAPGDFHIDPVQPVARAVITHGHFDHARPGHAQVLATAETLAIMAARGSPATDQKTFPKSFPKSFAKTFAKTQALAYGERLTVGDIALRLVPAGHILGSAQVVLEHKGTRVVVSGDYKRRPDPTCPPFEPQPCDIFITEATFGLPVFRHPHDSEEIGRLLDSLRLFPERSHLVGVYALGKCQRVIALLRRAGYDQPIWLHGALQALCDLYRAQGIELGALRLAIEAKKEELRGAIVLAPPSALADRWSRRLPDPVVAYASGWMRVKQRAKQKGVELPLVISDHADWDELTGTIAEIDPGEVWVTHGREEGLVRHAQLTGRKARALALVGFAEEEET